MIKINALDVIFSLDTTDPEHYVPVKLEGIEFSKEYFTSALKTVGGLYGRGVDLDSTNANDLFQALTVLGVMPRYIGGRGSIPQKPEPGAEY